MLYNSVVRETIRTVAAVEAERLDQAFGHLETATAGFR